MFLFVTELIQLNVLRTHPVNSTRFISYHLHLNELREENISL